MIFIAILLYAVLASTFTIGKIAVNYANPLFLVGIRMIISSLLLLSFYYIKFRVRHIKLWPAFKPEDFKYFFLVAIFHIFLPFAGEFWALQYIASIKVALIYSLTPFIAALLSYFLLNERFHKKQLFGLLIGFLGLLIMFSAHGEQEYLAGEIFSFSLPEIVLLLSVFSASYAWFLVKGLMEKGYGIGFINGWAMFLGGLMSLSLWAIIFKGQSPIVGEIYDFFFWTGLLIFLANVVVYNLYGWLLKHLPISFMSTIGFLCPIFAAFFGWYFLGEEIGASHLLALSMVIGGLVLFYNNSLVRIADKV